MNETVSLRELESLVNEYHEITNTDFMREWMLAEEIQRKSLLYLEQRKQHFIYSLGRPYHDRKTT